VISLEEKYYALLGVIGPFVTYFSIAISILYAPWFSWYRNALSDLGHSVNSSVAPIFNLGLFFTGSIVIVYALMVLIKHAKYTSIFMVASAILLQLIAVFDEVYGFLHGLVAVLFFLSIWGTSIVNAIEKKSLLALVAFLVGVISFVLYGLDVYNAGIAVPEIISFGAVATIVQYSAIKIYRMSH
jgi:hypothetical membrane protein